MPMPFRLFAVACATIALVAATHVHAQAYPEREIRIVVGFPAGSGADVYASYFAAKLQALAKQKVTVEHRPGAAAGVAAEYVARARPDGYTLFIAGSDTFAAPPHVFKKPTPDPRTDFVYVSPVVDQAFLLAVPAGAPYRNVTELTAAMKGKGDKGAYAATNHTAMVLGEIYKQSAGLATVQVRYTTNADYMEHIASGKLDFALVDPVFGSARIREGKMKALAVSTSRRLASLPDVPTMHEAGIAGVDINQWWLIAAPAGTPASIVEKLNAWFTEIGKTGETRDFLARNGAEPLTASAAQTKAWIDRDIANWARHVGVARIAAQ